MFGVCHGSKEHRPRCQEQSRPHAPSARNELVKAVLMGCIESARFLDRRKKCLQKQATKWEGGVSSMTTKTSYPSLKDYRFVPHTQSGYNSVVQSDHEPQSPERSICKITERLNKGLFSCITVLRPSMMLDRPQQ
jgi:hypothetical protein